jgi:predicted transcriptional regulator
MPAEYVPTAKQRALVENAAAFGITQAEIANQLGIQEKTLRKHFREELSSGKFKVDMLAIQALAGTAVCLAWLASRLVTAGLDPA